MLDSVRRYILNPHASDIATAVAERHVAGSVVMRQGGVVWALRKTRLWSVLNVLKAPQNPLYDTNGGSLFMGYDACQDLAGLFADIRERSDCPQVIIANSMMAEGPVWAALEDLAAAGSLKLTITASWERALLDRSVSPDTETYLETYLSSSQRKQLRRKRKALDEQGGLRLIVSDDAAGAMQGFETFCALEAAGWKGRDRTALQHHSADRRYVGDLLEAMAAAGTAFSAVLLLNDKPIASGLFLRAGGEVVFWKTTYDESLSKLSPGVIFDVMLTEYFYTQPWFERLDTGSDDSVDPAALIWKQRRRMANVVIDLNPGSYKGALVVAAVKLRATLRRWKNRRTQAAK
jgi:Acetyltransferase (GNAT) domain